MILLHMTRLSKLVRMLDKTNVATFQQISQYQKEKWFAYIFIAVAFINMIFNVKLEEQGEEPNHLGPLGFSAILLMLIIIIQQIYMIIKVDIILDFIQISNYTYRYIAQFSFALSNLSPIIYVIGNKISVIIY